MNAIKRIEQEFLICVKVRTNTDDDFIPTAEQVADALIRLAGPGAVLVDRWPRGVTLLDGIEAVT